MALRNQPYLPLFIQDFLTDEKLNECTAESTGVYIKIMCLMHKQDAYGCILLKQKDKQSEEQILNFALKLLKHLPFTLPEINRSLCELLSESVLFIEGDMLCQKRMIKDNDISEKRSNAGKNGGLATQGALKPKRKTFAKAKNKANSEYENEYVIEDSIIKKAFSNFKIMRNKIKKPMTDRAEKMICTKLEDLAPGNNELQAKILDQSTLNDWQDIYPLKQDRNLTQTSKVENVINIATAATFQEQQEA